MNKQQLSEIYQKIMKDKNGKNDKYKEVALLQRALLQEYYSAVRGYKFN